MRRLILAAILIGVSACSYAKPHQLSWTWPTSNCDGTTLDAADFIASELTYSTSPMPMNSDTDGPCASTPDGDAPAGAALVSIPLSDNVVTLNLQPGQTYYARIRVSAYIDGNWSSWSAEAEFTVPYGRPQRVILGAGNSPLDWYTFETVTQSHLRFGG